jgi:hypothetical protein
MLGASLEGGAGLMMNVRRLRTPLMAVVLVAACAEKDSGQESTATDSTGSPGSTSDGPASSDTGDDLPPCEPYEAGPRWIMWADSPAVDMSAMFEEKGPDGVVTGTVFWDGDEFTIEKGTFTLGGTWLWSDHEPPMLDGQTVKVTGGYSAGDDGCCDTESLYIWDESWNLLVAYAWISGLHDTQLGNGETVEADTTTTEACRYVAGEQPPVGGMHVPWAWVHGLALTGHYGDSQFAVSQPGESTTSDDGAFAVNWPIAHEGEVSLGGEPEWTKNTILEIVALQGV